MAITVEGTYTSTSVKTTESIITLMVVPNEANLAIYVFLSHHQKTASGGKYATGVSWTEGLGDPEPMTLVGRKEYNEEVVEIWRILDPTVGNGVVTITWDGNNANWDGSCHAAVVMSGVCQTTPDKGFVSNSQTTGIPSLDVPTISGDLCYGVISCDNQDPTENGDGTSQWNLTNDMSYGDGVSYISTDTVTNFSYSVTICDWAFAGISLNEAATPDPRIHNWRWYAANDSTPRANQNVKPTLTEAEAEDGVVLHLCFFYPDECQEILQGVTLDVEYSINESDWYPLGGQGTTGDPWRWDDNPNLTEHGLTTGYLTCRTGIVGLVHEAACSNFNRLFYGGHDEYPICLEAYNPTQGVTYSFRIKVDGAYPDLYDPPNTYPQIEMETTITTEGPNEKQINRLINLGINDRIN